MLGVIAVIRRKIILYLDSFRAELAGDSSPAFFCFHASLHCDSDAMSQPGRLRSPFQEGFAVLREEPLLLAVELTWRWCFGLAAWILALAAAALFLDSLHVSVGDSEVDVLTARNANLWSIGVTYGFAPHTLERTHPDILVDTPEELAAALTVIAD